MSSDPATAGSDSGTEGTHAPTSRLRSVRTVASLDRGRCVVAAGSVGVLALAVQRTVEILANLPARPLVLAEARSVVSVGVPLVLGFTLVCVALAVARPTVRVGLLFAGVFGLLATIDAAATLPGSVAVVAGGAVAVAGTVGRPSTYHEIRRAVVAAGLVAGVAISLTGSTGLVEGGLRAVGSLVALGSLAAVVIRVEDDRVGLFAGLSTLGAVVLASATSPYVVGSVSLIGFAAAGAPHALVVLAVAGGTAAAVSGLRRREPTLAVGACLLLLAGVPVTAARAMAVLLGAVFVLSPPGSFAASDVEPPEVSSP